MKEPLSHNVIDQELVDIIMPMIELVRLYHRHEVVGLENVPSKGGALVVVNHSLATYDILLLWAAIYEGRSRFTRGLVDRLFYKFPGVGHLVQVLGAAEGSPANATRLLTEGELVCVAPGGMREALRPSEERYQIDWERRLGFAKLAIKTQVPIVLAACPKSDDLYEVYPSSLTKWVYKRFRIPLFLARGIGISPVPRPVKLIHYLSKPIHPPKVSEAGITDEIVRAFHKKLVRKMLQLMARGVVSP